MKSHALLYTPCRRALWIWGKSHLPSSLSEAPADGHRQMAKFHTSLCLTDWGTMVKEELGGSHFQSPWKPQRVRTGFTEPLHSPWLISAIHLQSDLDQAEALSSNLLF